jgi:hypothetical protein
MLLRFHRRLCIVCQINVDMQLVKANRTLSDEASDELLFLYGRADTALEIALVEHIGHAFVSGYCNKYCK